MIVDLTQFWRDHPHYVGTKKEYGIYGMIVDTAPNATNARGEFQVALDHDFIVCGVATIQESATLAAYIAGNPTRVQVFLPGHGGRRLIENHPNFNQKVDWNCTLKTNAGGIRQQNSVVWMWPYPIVIPAGERVAVEIDSSDPDTIRNYFGFQGIKAFL
jgi:hypothetical protein